MGDVCKVEITSDDLSSIVFGSDVFPADLAQQLKIGPQTITVFKKQLKLSSYRRIRLPLREEQVSEDDQMSDMEMQDSIDFTLDSEPEEIVHETETGEIDHETDIEEIAHETETEDIVRETETEEIDHETDSEEIVNGTGSKEFANETEKEHIAQKTETDKIVHENETEEIDRETESVSARSSLQSEQTELKKCTEVPAEDYTSSGCHLIGNEPDNEKRSISNTIPENHPAEFELNVQGLKEIPVGECQFTCLGIISGSSACVGICLSVTEQFLFTNDIVNIGFDVKETLTTFYIKTMKEMVEYWNTYKLQSMAVATALKLPVFQNLSKRIMQDEIMWQDFRDKYRPGIGREEWARICR